MKGISGYEKLILALTAGFILLCAGIFFLGGSGQRYTVTVSERSPENVFLAEDVQSDGTPDSLLPGEKIDINTAPPLDLARLPGIGDSRAQAIADYRESSGPFQSVEELVLVKGIGEGILEQVREYICVG